MDRKFVKDKWHVIAISAGVGATVLFLLFIYAPYGVWKVDIALLLIVAVVVMM